MAEHDLWNEEDFFEKLKKEKKAAEKPQTPESESEEPKEIPASPLESEPEISETDLFQKEESVVPENEAEEDIFFNDQNENVPLESSEVAEDFEEELPELPVEEEEPAFEKEEEAAPQQEPEEEEKSAPTPPKRYALSDNYEDEKLAPVNYKPVIIGAVVVVLIILIFFLLRGFVFKSNAPEEAKSTASQKTEQKTSQATPAAQNPLQVKQNQFMAQVAGYNAYALGVLQSIREAIGPKQAMITSLLFYKDEITFEIHCKDRNILANVINNLRKVSQLNKLRLVASDDLPDGAINAVFHAVLTGSAEPRTPGAKIADSGALNQWLAMVGQQFNIKVDGFKELETSPSELGLKRIRVFTQATGSFDGLLNFIQALAAANKNIKVHKLVLAAPNSGSFKKANYRIELTLDLFK